MNQAASFPTPSATLFPIGPNGKESNQVSYQRLSLSKKKTLPVFRCGPQPKSGRRWPSSRTPGQRFDATWRSPSAHTPAQTAARNRLGPSRLFERASCPGISHVDSRQCAKRNRWPTSVLFSSSVGGRVYLRSTSAPWRRVWPPGRTPAAGRSRRCHVAPPVALPLPLRSICAAAPAAAAG